MTNDKQNILDQMRNEGRAYRASLLQHLDENTYAQGILRGGAALEDANTRFLLSAELFLAVQHALEKSAEFLASFIKPNQPVTPDRQREIDALAMWLQQWNRERGSHALTTYVTIRHVLEAVTDRVLQELGHRPHG